MGGPLKRTGTGSLALVSIKGVEKPLSEWCIEFGVPLHTVRYRVNQRGLSIQAALAEPFKTRELHGITGSSEYLIWGLIKDRCLNSEADVYGRYGGRGITICERWKNSFTAFLDDVGRRPSARHSLDRYPDNDGNYEPGNVRWATSIEQSNNRRDNVRVEIDGRVLTVAEWCREKGISRDIVWSRIYKHGWSHVKAITTPKVRPWKKKVA